MTRLFVFPASSKDPEPPLPYDFVRMHETMLSVLYGVDADAFETSSQLLRCSLWVQRWHSLLKLGAIHHAPYRMVANKPGRQALLHAIRMMDAEGIVTAFRESVDADQLPEIEREWKAIVDIYKDR